MSDTMTRQGGRVQLDQSTMCLALNRAQMAEGWLLCVAINDTHCLIKKPHANVREQKMWGGDFPAHRKVKVAMERHPAMVRDNETDVCLPCQMAQQRICRHTGGIKDQVHLCQNWCHHCPELHVRHPVTMREHKHSKWMLSHPDLWI